MRIMKQTNIQMIIKNKKWTWAGHDVGSMTDSWVDKVTNKQQRNCRTQDREKTER